MSLVNDVLQMLVDAGTDEAVADLALAAVEGPESLGAAMRGEGVERPAPIEDDRAAEIPGAYLASIEVTGFRGIGATSRLELAPEPGLTMVVGRNGSGKSSFAEGLEVLLTGDSYRWKNKPAEWKQGWRDLHRSEGNQCQRSLRC